MKYKKATPSIIISFHAKHHYGAELHKPVMGLVIWEEDSFKRGLATVNMYFCKKMLQRTFSVWVIQLLHNPERMQHSFMTDSLHN